MPRNGRGGVRTGTPGKSYSNRTDLNATSGKPLPVQTAPSTEYGQAIASARSQAAVPMAPQAPPPPLPGAGGGGGAAPTPPGGFGDPLRPTEQPDVHVMSGLPVGPGPGPEALSMNAPDPTLTVLANLRGMGDQLPAALKPFVASLQASMSNGRNG